MVSLPRDTVDIPLGNGQVWSGKVNGIANSYGLDGLRHGAGHDVGRRDPVLRQGQHG